MIGTSWMRQQGPKDALMVEALRRGAADGVMLWRRSHPVRDSCMKAWNDITPLRDGPVNPERVEVDDPAASREDLVRDGREGGPELLAACGPPDL